jgi:hypothetical protein
MRADSLETSTDAQVKWYGTRMVAPESPVNGGRTGGRKNGRKVRAVTNPATPPWSRTVAVLPEPQLSLRGQVGELGKPYG